MHEYLPFYEYSSFYLVNLLSLNFTCYHLVSLLSSNVNHPYHTSPDIITSPVCYLDHQTLTTSSHPTGCHHTSLACQAPQLSFFLLARVEGHVRNHSLSSSCLHHPCWPVPHKCQRVATMWLLRNGNRKETAGYLAMH